MKMLFLALVLAGCSAPASTTNPATSSPSAIPTAATEPPVTTSCIILVPSRFLDDLTPFTLQIDEMTAVECAEFVEHNNNADAFAKEHPEVVLDAAPSHTPLCSEVLMWPGSGRTARETVWGYGIAAITYCRTIRFIADPSQVP